MTQMTTIPLEQEIEDGTELLGSLHAAIRSLRREIEALTTRVSGEDTVQEKEVTRSMRDVSGLIVQCAKAEMNLDECKKKQAGIVQGGYALDLDQARIDIGCKLDRLRRCADPG